MNLGYNGVVAVVVGRKLYRVCGARLCGARTPLESPLMPKTDWEVDILLRGYPNEEISLSFFGIGGI